MTARGGLPRRIAGFTGLPVLALVTSLLFLPIVARVAGGEALVAVAVGQSVGGFLSLLVALGFNTLGPTAVAKANPVDRLDILTGSVHARLVVFFPCALVAFAAAFGIAPAAYQLETAVMAVAMTLNGLSSAWYLVGLGRPGRIALFEFMPRIVATVVAAAILVLTGEIIWYPLLLIVAMASGVSAYLGRELGMARLLNRSPGRLRRVFIGNRSGVATEFAAGAYNSLVVAFVGLTATLPQTAVYVAGDKLYRVGQQSVSALGNALQGWVVERRDQFVPRIVRALALHGALGGVGFAVFALFGSALSELLFGAEFAIDEVTALGFGVATLGISLGTALGRITLISLGARREFFASVLLGTVVGIPAILVLSTVFGAAGGAWGLALGEVVSVIAQGLFVLRRCWHHRTGGGQSSP